MCYNRPVELVSGDAPFGTVNAIHNSVRHNTKGETKMKEFTLIEFKTQEAINNYNYPVAIEVAGTLFSGVSESHGIYSTPAVKVVRDAEVEYSF